MQTATNPENNRSFIDRIEEVAISVFLGVAIILVFAQVVARYAFDTGISWAPELVEYLFLWSVMIGASYGVKQGVHLGVDVLVAKLPETTRRQATLLAILISLSFTMGMAYLSVFYVYEAYKMELITVDLQIPQWIPHLALPLGFAMISIRFIQVGWRVMSGRQDKIAQSGEAASELRD